VAKFGIEFGTFRTLSQYAKYKTTGAAQQLPLILK